MHKLIALRGSVVTSDAGSLAYRELDHVLELTDRATGIFVDTGAGKNARRALAGLFPQSGFGRGVGDEDVNDAERLRHDPALCWVVGGGAATFSAESPSHIRRFEERGLAAEKNLSRPADLSGRWIGRVSLSS